MPIGYSKASLQAEEDMIRRSIHLLKLLLEINLKRQLRIQEADRESHDDKGN